MLENMTLYILVECIMERVS